MIVTAPFLPLQVALYAMNEAPIKAAASTLAVAGQQVATFARWFVSEERPPNGSGGASSSRGAGDAASPTMQQRQRQQFIRTG